MTKEERIKQWCAEAEAVGLEHIERVDGEYSKYRFWECGHEQTIRRDNVRLCNFKCQVCNSKDWHQEAAEHELEHQEYVDRRYSKYRFVGCMHEQVIQRSNVRNGNFACQQCESSHWDKPHGTYLIKFKSNDFEWCKVGVAQDVNTRIRSFGLREDIEVSIQYFHMQTSRHIAQKKVESICHSKYNEHRLSPDEMKQYMLSGFTECFSIDVSGKLLIEIATNREANEDNEFNLSRFYSSK